MANTSEQFVEQTVAEIQPSGAFQVETRRALFAEFAQGEARHLRYQSDDPDMTRVRVHVSPLGEKAGEAVMDIDVEDPDAPENLRMKRFTIAGPMLVEAGVVLGMNSLPRDSIADLKRLPISNHCIASQYTDCSPDKAQELLVYLAENFGLATDTN